MSSEETRDEALDRSRGVDLQLWRRLWTFTRSYRRQVAWLIVRFAAMPRWSKPSSAR